jgi:hypothetical protein
MMPASYSADRRCDSAIHSSLGEGHSPFGKLSLVLLSIYFSPVQEIQ